MPPEDALTNSNTIRDGTVRARPSVRLGPPAPFKSYPSSRFGTVLVRNGPDSFPVGRGRLVELRLQVIEMGKSHALVGEPPLRGLFGDLVREDIQRLARRIGEDPRINVLAALSKK